MSTAPSVPPRPVVALDGPGSSGKSSVGAAAARALGYRFVDTGLFYRALTAAAIRRGLAPDQVPALVSLVDAISLVAGPDGVYGGVLLDGEDITAALTDPAVDASVSAYARIPEVRDALLPRQRELAAGGGIVVAGRDIGTVVLPDATLKVFLDASVDERAARRIAERGVPAGSAEADEIRYQLRLRDEVDSTRAVAPLRAAEDARHIRTDGNTFEQTVALVVAEIRAVAGEAPPASPQGRVAPRRSARAPGDADELAVDNSLSLLVRMVALVSRIGARLFARVRVDGLDRIPRTGPVILAANHISNGDPVILGAWLTTALRRRRIHWLGKRELFDWPIFGWLARNGGVHPVDRSTADVEAFRLASRILEAGWVLLIFPEGTRSPTGELQEAKDGLATLALRTGAFIVPIGVNNTDAVWPKGRTLPLPLPRHTIHVRIGEPFSVSELVPAGTERRAAKALATRLIMGRIAELLQPRHRGVYATAIREGSSTEL
jgi:cytidylate kinase